MAEPICMPEEDQFGFSLQPRFPDLHEQYLAARAVFWQPHEIPFAQDLAQFLALPQPMQTLFKKVMALFGIADGLINANLGHQFLQEAQSQVCQSFYSFQMTIENVHAETYALLIKEYITDAAERERTKQAAANFPVIAAKKAFVLRYCDGTLPFARRVVAFAAIESVFFTPSFAVFAHAKHKGILPALCKANDFITRDEGTHVLFACSVYKHLEHKLPVGDVHAVIREATAIEKDFVDFLLLGPGGENLVPQFTAADLKGFTECAADKLCLLLGVPIIYGTKNPMPEMETFGVFSKINFFEKLSHTYQMRPAAARLDDEELDA